MQFRMMFQTLLSVCAGLVLANSAGAATPPGHPLIMNERGDSALVRTLLPNGQVQFEVCATSGSASRSAIPETCRVIQNTSFDGGDVELQRRLNEGFLREYDASYLPKAYRYIATSAAGGGFAGWMLSTPRKIQRTISARVHKLNGTAREFSVVITSRPFANYLLAGAALGLVVYKTFGILRTKRDRKNLDALAVMDSRLAPNALILANDDFERVVDALDTTLRVVR